MIKTWKIVATTKKLGGGPPQKDYFLAAIPNHVAAIEALRTKRPDLDDADLSVEGEATADSVEWLNVRDGEIVCLVPLS